MKTQLLEDIGQNAGVSLAPVNIAGIPKADKKVQTLAPAGEPPAPLELHSVFEEIAALEAQLVPPGLQHEPSIAPAEPPNEIPGSPAAPLHKLAVPPAARLLRPVARPAEPLHQAAIPPAEPTLVPDPMQSPTVPRDPLFDFTPPAPAYQAADPFTRPPAVLTRSRQRYLLWGACVLSGVLLILGGRSVYQERNDAGALALIADEAKTEPQAAKAVKRAAISASESNQAPDGDVTMAPAVPASRPSPGVPPLVLLEPDPSTATRPEPPPPSVTDRAEPRTPPRPEPVAEQAPASPSPKPSSQKARVQSDAAAKPAREASKRESVRQYVRAPAIVAKSPSGQDTSMTATLKACRERGYGAAQCVKQGCSMTTYGFVCRGR